MSWGMPMSLHIGRAAVGHRAEDECPCPQEPCGLVDTDCADDACPDHAISSRLRLRQWHDAKTCPGAP